MKILNGAKSVCDLLLFFTFAALIPFYRNSWLIVGVVLVLAFLATVVLQMTKETMFFKVICGLIPFLGLLVCKTKAELIITAIIVSFYTVITVASQVQIHYQDYKTWFGIPLLPVIIVFVICFTLSIQPLATACSGAYLFLGTIVLRGKRMGEGAGIQHRLMNVAEVSGTISVGVVVNLIILFLLRHSGHFFEIILTPFAAIFYGLAYLAGKFLGGLIVIPQTDQEVYGFTKSPDVPNRNGPDVYKDPPLEKSMYDILDKVLIVFLLVVAVIIFIAIIICVGKVVHNIWFKGSDLSTFEEGSADSEGRRGFRWKKKKKRALLTNNEKIRQIYRDYLFFVGTYGIEVKKETTSEEVMTQADSIADSMGAERLRELYILARYRDDKQLEDSEVEEARNIFEDIKSKFGEDVVES